MEKVTVITFSISKRKYNIGCRGKHTAQISSLIVLNHPLTLNVLYNFNLIQWHVE